MKRPQRQLKHSQISSIRNRLLEKQNGLCLICKEPIVRACLDHSHKKRIKGTGLVRGVLCSNCNIFLAKSENNCVRYGIDIKDLPFILRQMADYLERPHTHYMHPSEKPKELRLSKNSFKKLLKAFKETYPNRKNIEYPKSGKLTKTLQELFDKFNIEPVFKKGK